MFLSPLGVLGFNQKDLRALFNEFGEKLTASYRESAQRFRDSILGHRKPRLEHHHCSRLDSPSCKTDLDEPFETYIFNKGSGFRTDKFGFDVGKLKRE